MQKEWSSFRITLILYLVVLILPFSFYFVYSSFKTMQHDTKIVRQSSWTAGAMAHLAVKHTDQNDQALIGRVDKTLHEISLWITKNSDSKLYIGSQTLSKDFSEVNSCWTAHKKSFSQHNTTAIRQHSLQCYRVVDNMAIIVEKMVYLKQNKIINIFYLSLTFAMIFALLMIYLVRTYIHIQMKKHTIHDHETKLFNKKYFLAELHSTCARSKRHENPLSLLFVSLGDFTKETYDKKTRKALLLELGELFTFVTREGDILCRYDENHFAVLLPLTTRENALVLEDRLKENMKKHDFRVTPEVEFSFITTQLDTDETEESFITRTKKMLG